jgi:hypothetical protein
MLDASGDVREVVTFPAVQQQPVMLDSKEHVVGYLSKILNARVYDAAIETELQLAKNLSTVRMYLLFWCPAHLFTCRTIAVQTLVSFVLCCGGRRCCCYSTPETQKYDLFETRRHSAGFFVQTTGRV